MPITSIQKTQYSPQILPQGMPSGNVGMPIIQDNFFKNSKNEKTEQIGTKDNSPLYKTTIQNEHENCIVIWSPEKKDIGSHNKIIYKQLREVKNSSGNILYREYQTPSKVDGVCDIIQQDTNGKIRHVSSGKNFLGFKVIEKNLESLNGVKTKVKIKEDIFKNSKMEYKITNAKGDILLDLKRSFKKTGLNSAVSKVNGRKYKIKHHDSYISVLDVSNAKEERIELSHLNPKNNPKISKMLKNLPGDVLLDLNKSGGLIYFEETKSAQVNNFEENCILTTSNPSVLLHETGHVKDGCKFSSKKEFKEIFEKEKAQYNKYFGDFQKSYMNKFFNEEIYMDKAPMGYLEVFAEAYLLSTLGRNTDEETKNRAEILQRYFPETLAYAVGCHLQS